jgi:sterol 24-C-methyltransferase
MRASSTVSAIIVALFAYFFVSNSHWTTIYQFSQAAKGLSQLFNLSDEDVKACVDAYTYLQNGTSDLAGAGSDSEVETEHVRKYYRVLQPLLRIADIEKMYIPPQIDAKLGEIYR